MGFGFLTYKQGLRFIVAWLLKNVFLLKIYQNRDRDDISAVEVLDILSSIADGESAIAPL